MNTQTQIKILILGVFLIFATVFLVLRGPIVLSSHLSNFGAIILNHSQANDGSLNNANGYIPNTLEARQALERATQLNEQNNSAWRTLGHIWLTQEEDKALAAWQHVPDMGYEMQQWADRAADRRDLANALTWHRRHTALFPELGDSWYYQGLIQTQQKNWPEAISAFEEASQRNLFETPLLSDAYFQLGSIYQWAPDYRDLDRALSMYDTALQIDLFSNEVVKAETFYKRGEIYSWLGREDTAVSEFQKALNLYPSHTWARLRHSYFRYWIDKEIEPAEQGVMEVIAIWRENNSANLKWAYQYLGDIYEDAGMINAAVTAYEEVAQLDPTNSYVQNKLAGLRKE